MANCTTPTAKVLINISSTIANNTVIVVMYDCLTGSPIVSDNITNNAQAFTLVNSGVNSINFLVCNGSYSFTNVKFRIFEGSITGCYTETPCGNIAVNC